METETTFQVKQGSFEGPIEVLLELIEKRKLFVGDLKLADVTDDFVHYIESNGIEPGLVAQFLSVAATLILIKARALLPTLDLSPEESESIADLERRVALYGLISELSNTLAKRYGKKVLYEGASRLGKTIVFAPDERLTTQTLHDLALGILTRVPPKAPPKPEVRMRVTISMKEVLATLEERIKRAMNTSFNAIRMQAPEGDTESAKVYTIVSFLGMLELVRRGLVKAEQGELFSDISLEQENVISPPTTSEEADYA